ncbi:atp-dependent helicase [Methylobacterium sp. J-030]|uniref:atp-dependent helicase n=1 Tax=Methylobacterium sp. J-030 TaxID=2836627 RepID=UPI001FB96218|nr:atp-dependent helicase [Methylobacterium sp. J-030]MCJ2070692.1 atp-dependent helicase [Methylobacterium sp. J-030]
MTVTGEETLAQDLRETQAELEGARAEIASLKVLLALRTHQHDQAWQAARSAAAERDMARPCPNPAARAPVDSPSDADSTMPGATAHTESIARAEVRADAVRIVLGAILKSLRFWGLDRRRFQALIVQAGRETPETGPEAERHRVLLAEARRVLGRAD